MYVTYIYIYTYVYIYIYIYISLGTLPGVRSLFAFHDPVLGGKQTDNNSKPEYLVNRSFGIV